MKKENKEIKKESKDIKEEHEISKEAMKNMFKIVETLVELPSADSKATKGTFGNDGNEVIDIVTAKKEYWDNIKKLRAGQIN